MDGSHCATEDETTGTPPASGQQGNKRTWGGETDHAEGGVSSAKMPRLATAPDRTSRSGSGDTHEMAQQLLQQQDDGEGGRAKRARKGAAALEETQAAVETGKDLSSGGADGAEEKSLATGAQEKLELCLRVLDARGQETEVVAQVRADTVDLSAHTGLLVLPEALRGLTAMRELTVVSTALRTLPEWLGELHGREVLRVQGESLINNGRCPLHALPKSLCTLTGLTTLNLEKCEALTALPKELGALTRLTTLDLGEDRKSVV